MTHEPMTDDRFERDLRDLLADLAPSSVPAHVHEAVARVPRSAPSRSGVTRRPRTRQLFAALGAAVATLVVVAALVVTIGHPFGLGGYDAGAGGGSPSPSVTPGPMRDEYRVLPAGGLQPTADDLAAIASILTHRLEATGLVAPDVTVVAPDRIVAVIPGPDDDAANQLRKLIGTTGRVDFVPLGSTPAQQDQQLSQTTLSQPCDAGHTVDCVLFSGDQVASASIDANQSGQRTVDIVLRDAGARLFGDYTAGHVGDYFAVVLDGTVITAPTISEAIPGGQVQISQSGQGGYPLAEAQDLVTILQFGQLPFPLQEVAFGP